MKKISVKKINKEFKIEHNRNCGALKKFTSLFSGNSPKEKICVLNNISLDAHEGEIVGIIGKNGSGKSTLLKIIAGIYKQDKGEIKTKGKIISILGLGNGMNERLSAKDNIRLYCSILGLKQNEIKGKIPEIIKFAELEKFIDTKIHKFSTGMKLRLAFSTAINSIRKNEKDILLLDEIFATGDWEYTQKCIKKIKELVSDGTSALVISHQLSILEKICNRIIWIDKGEIIMDSGLEVIDKYKELMSKKN